MSEGNRLESAYYTYMGYDSEHSSGGLSHYLPYFPAGPVLELAPGRGEFLALLQEAGVEARGVDSDDGMVEAARARGLDVRLADALDGLRQEGGGSLGGVFSAHFVEHLPPDLVRALVAESARALRPGGVFVAATPNAGSQSVMGHDFWRDPTHLRFYDRRLLAFFCAEAGLEVVEVGENPRNAPGPPPETLCPKPQVDPDLRADLATTLQRITDPKGRGKADPDSPWLQFGHLVSTLMAREQQVHEELAALHRAHHRLLERLYPSNEVYVVARRA